MTKLELAICEAENSGEIDLDTRDMMLSVLTEGQGTAQYRAAKRVGDEEDKIREILKEEETCQS